MKKCVRANNKDKSMKRVTKKGISFKTVTYEKIARARVLKLPTEHGSRIHGTPTLNLRALKRINQSPKELVIT